MKKCLLQKALYETKQAARQWNNKLNRHLKKQGFNTTTAEDLCVYIRESSDEYSIIVIYLYDLMLFCNTKEDIKMIKSALKSEYSIKELGDLKFCLGMELYRNHNDRLIKMNQSAYIKRLAEKFGVEKDSGIGTITSRESVTV